MAESSLVGVDGCRAGWVAVGERSGRLFVELWSSLERLFAEPWAQACVDIPIGLQRGNQRRRCDLEARRMLGPQRSSVFFTPPRELLGAEDYEEVRAHGMSLQTFYILPKIREMDELLKPGQQAWVRETHPELAYRTRSVQELAKKKSAEGRAQREQLLGEVGSPFRLSDWSSAYLRKDVALDDLLDAAILLEVAREWSTDRGRSLGGEERDSRGLKMEICF